MARLCTSEEAFLVLLGAHSFFFFFLLNPTDVEEDVQRVSVWRSNGAVRV